MPVYEYKCHDCGDQFDITQGVKDKSPEKCIKCNGVLVRLISAPAFHLKGGGWYKDGYSSEKKENKPASQTDSASKKTEADSISSSEKITPKKTETDNTSSTSSSEKIAVK